MHFKLADLQQKVTSKKVCKLGMTHYLYKSLFHFL